MAFTYPARVIGSNFEPIQLSVSKEGLPLDPTGVAVRLTVKDKDTSAVLVDNQQATVVPEKPGYWQYRFPIESFSTITTNSVLLIQWTVTVDTFVFITPEPAQMTIRRPL